MKITYIVLSEQYLHMDLILLVSLSFFKPHNIYFLLFLYSQFLILPNNHEIVKKISETEIKTDKKGHISF